MKSLVIALAVAFVAAIAVPTEAEARRFGGGGFSGMQRSTPRTAPAAAPTKPATPNAQPGQAGAAGAAAAAPRRSWMGPIAGLAAGLGLAALMSHLGLGAEFANIIMLALLGVVAFVAIRFLMRRFAPGAAGNARGMHYANANVGSPGASTGTHSVRPFDTQLPAPAAGSSAFGNGFDAHAATLHDRGESVNSLPAGFDAAGFERIAKMIFIRMQTANDAGDLNDLRNFTTPEMFAAARLDLQERGAMAQRTDVVRVDAEVLDVASQAEQQIVSVRFHGLIREEAESVAEPFDEVWHLVKPADGSREWAIAGIQQSTAALLAEAA